MTIEAKQLTICGMKVDLVRKDIKNLHLAVYPPRGRVRVAAPLRLNDEAVRLAVVSRLAWIRGQQRSFDSQDRQSERELVSGESHYVDGRRYRLRVVERELPPSVRMTGARTLELAVRPGTDRDGRQRALDRWRRTRLQKRIPMLIEKWQPIMGVSVASWAVRRMRTKWGSCQPTTRNILLNLELSKKPVACLEYIVVHELVHLLERNHTDRFRALMDEYFPSWRARREELNRAPLAHEDWAY